MTQNRTRNASTTARDAQTRKIREGTDQPATLVGYDPGTGDTPRAWPGDEQAPFVAVPPMHEEAAQVWMGRLPYLPSYPYPMLDPSALTNPPQLICDLDVSGYRLLTIFFSLDLPAGSYTSQIDALALLPEVGIACAPDLVFALGVIDPTIRGAFPTATNTETSLNPPFYGYRNSYQTQINVPLRPNGGTPPPVPADPSAVRQALAFDVAPYQRFRLSGGVTHDLRTVTTFPADIIGTLLYKARFFAQLTR